MINAIDPVDKWHLDRWGKFTASEIHKLMPGGIEIKGSIFSKGGIGYIEKKVVEEQTTMQERPELEGYKNFLHGKSAEIPAMERYLNETRLYNAMQYFGSYEPIYVPYTADSGGSPDGGVGIIGNFDWGVELKCPINPVIHWRYLAMKDQWSLAANYPEMYGQCQMHILINNADGWHWCSFCDVWTDKKKQVKIIEVLPDKKYLNVLETRISQATSDKWKQINQPL